MRVTLDHVARYLELGFVVHPCCSVEHRCQSPGKIPFDPIAGKHMARWQDHEQFSLDQWQEWLDYDSELNIGFLTGSPSRLVCIDIDSEEGKGILDDAGIEHWQSTWRYVTGRGIRLLFHHQEKAKSAVVSRSGASFEVLGDGRQSVLPPSMHPNGKRYAWVNRRTPRDGYPEPAGDWLERLVPTLEITSDRRDWTEDIQTTTLQGERNTKLVSLAGHLMHPGPMPPEEAYVWLDLYNQRHCKPPLPDKEVRSIVDSISRKEAAQEAQKNREIRDLMKTHDVTWDQAETMWRGM